jgi:hypothetical protein
MAKTHYRKRKGGPSFIQLFKFVKRSQAYHDLSTYARCLLFEILERYTGCNNGMIGLGVREASFALNCAHGTVCKAMRELDDSGLAQPLTPGAWRGKRATEWRVTFYRCDKTGELPIKNLPEVTWESAKGHVGKHKGGLEAPPMSARKAQKPKNPISENALRSRSEAHIDSNQGIRKLVAAAGRASAEVTTLSPEPVSSPNLGEKNNFAPSGAIPEDPTGCPSEWDPRLEALNRWGRAAELIGGTDPPADPEEQAA